MSLVRCLCLLLALCLNMSLALESFMAEDGYEIFPTVPGSRYKLYTLQHTWGEALSLCQGDGGGSHLVIINSDSEAQIIQQLFARIIDTKITWLSVGINDIVQEGNWVTIAGDLLTTTGFNKWEPGEPNNSHNEDCGTVSRSPLYNDHHCDDPAPFICEKPNFELA